MTIGMYVQFQAYKYQEEYELALLGFARAAALDPTWTEPKEKEQHMVGYLTRVQDLIKTRVGTHGWLDLMRYTSF